jgi:arylsulfatase A
MKSSANSGLQPRSKHMKGNKVKRRSFMAAVAVIMAYCGGAQAANKQPNIVFILVDDMPWYGTATEQQDGFAGSKMEWRNTPNIDALAKLGMTFSSAHSAAGMCAPSRCSIQTGMTAARTRFSGNGGFGESAPSEVEYITKPKGALLLEPMPLGNLNQKFPTIAEELKKLGYATAHFGKWHVYGGGPEKHGYDESDGETSNDEGGKLNTDPEDPKRMFSMTRSTIGFIERQHKAGKPFYVQVSHYAEHSQQQSLPETLAKYENDPRIKAMGKNDGKEVATHAAAVEDMDSAIGVVLRKLDDLGIRDNTYVFFAADNGKGLYNGDHRILRGGKWWLWEGGIRVPMIVAGPKIAKAARCSENVVGYDFLPTFVNLAGGNTKDLAEIDGVSIKPLLEQGDASGFTDRALFFHYPHSRNATTHSAIIKGKYKLYTFYEIPDQPYLYDLQKDIGEVVNIAGQMPEKAKAMKGELDAYLTSVSAYLPKPNPDASPDYQVFNPARDIPPVCDLVDGEIMSKKKISKMPAEETPKLSNEETPKLTKEEKQKRREERKKKK